MFRRKSPEHVFIEWATDYSTALIRFDGELTRYGRQVGKRAYHTETLYRIGKGFPYEREAFENIVDLGYELGFDTSVNEANDKLGQWADGIMYGLSFIDRLYGKNTIQT